MSRFRVVAGPTGRPPTCSFDLIADRADAALEKVTTALRVLYGADWWADVHEFADDGHPRSGDGDVRAAGPG
jgi:hypothetical protein